ncbi:MAG TPA: beta-L-arabinofuranosidase domain-containing protein [Acidobacteriaceae bacterium]|nr:beta-L-arabinofuranosidase domain-containing protein [Acidobacteriaceae bacterium]
MNRASRRTFLKGALTATGAALVPRSSLAAAFPGPGITKLSQFSYGDVQLLEGPMLDQFHANHAFFLALSDDSLLQPFRQKAGLPAPGEEMGGWYSWSKDFDPPQNMTGYIPGHSFGQYLSSLARAYAATGDEPTRNKIRRLVDGYGATVTTKFYDGYPLPAYTFDKINCGLIDAHRFARDPQALAVLSHATDAVLPWLPPKALTREEMRARPHPNIAYTWDESYTLPENLFLAYQCSADARYLTLARRFLQDDAYFNPLSEGHNILAGLHAYSHVNALSSASQAYLVLGSEKHLRAARNGFAFVIDTQSFATGGWGPNEAFRAPGSGDMGASLTQTHASFETPCGAYGHFKIARYLIRVTADSRYGDSMENVLYNTILGAKPIQPDGHSFYYSDYNNSGLKSYYPEKWPCCSGTFPQITADYGISSYFHSPHAVFVNLFVPSRLTWLRNGTRVAIEQRTQYPYSPEVNLRIRTSRPETFAVYLRVPAWAGDGTTVAVNGRAFPSDLRPGTFVPIRREWKDGDRMEYHIDMPLRLEAIDPQHPQIQALLAGPLTLFAVDSLKSEFTRAQLLAAQQSKAGSSEWTVRSGTETVTFRSFPAIDNQKYRLYHQVSVS